MDSITTRRGVDVAWCLAALAALWTLTRILPGQDACAPAVILIASSVVLLAIVDGPCSPIALGVPILMLVVLLASDERAKLLLSGIVLAAGLAFAASRWTSEGRMSTGRGIVLLVSALVPSLLFLPGDGGLVAVVLTIVGAVAIVLVSSREGGVGLDAVILACCAAMAAPTSPVRASLFVLVVAATVLVLKRPAWLTGALLLLVVIAGGKWYLPLLVAVAAGFVAGRVGGARSVEGAGNKGVVVPFLSGIPVAALSSLAIAPDAWARLTRVGVAAAVTAVALAAGALIVQPSLAMLYAITALACLLLVGESRATFSPALAAFGLVMAALSAWSGVMSSAFPLPVPLAVVVLMAIAASLVYRRTAPDDVAGRELPSRFHLPDIARSALVAGLAAALVLLHPFAKPATEQIATDIRLGSGQTRSIDLPPDSRVVRLKVSGGNIAGLPRGTVAGVVRVEPGGETHELVIGEFADWGAGRREHFLSADNPRPTVSAGVVHGMGRDAFLSGSGLVRLDVSRPERLTIEVSSSIGEKGRLMIESVEVEK